MEFLVGLFVFIMLVWFTIKEPVFVLNLVLLIGAAFIMTGMGTVAYLALSVIFSL